MGFVEEARAARAAAEGARAAYRGRVARAERSFPEARETRAESERSLEDALGSALLIARFKSLRLYPDRIECKGEAIRLGEVLGIDAEMEGEVLRREHTNVNSWSRSVRTIDKRTAVVTVRTPEWEYSVRTGPGQEASARRFVEAARDVLADPGRYREWRDARIAGMPGGPRAGGRREGGGGRGLVRPRGRPGGHAGGRGRRGCARGAHGTGLAGRPLPARRGRPGRGQARFGREGRPRRRPRAPGRAFGVRALRRPLRSHFRPRRVPLHGRPPAQHGGGRRAGRVVDVLVMAFHCHVATLRVPSDNAGW